MDIIGRSHMSITSGSLRVKYDLRLKDTGKRRESVSHIYSLLSNG